MKNIKKFCSALCIIILFVGYGKFFHYILVDDTSSYTRLTMHELYHAESNIDVLFVGSSHVYRSLNPEITDHIFGLNTFNAGTSSQGMDGSLAVIKETAAYHNLSQIYLDVYFGIALMEPNKDRSQLTQTYIISDYMKPSIRKIKYLLQASAKDYYVNGFIPARRDWEKLFDLAYIFDLVKKKQTDNYKNYKWTKNKNDTEYYVTKGYVANETVMQENAYSDEKTDTTIDLTSISDDWKKSLQDIIDFCKKERIQLTLFSTPMSESFLIKNGNYGDYSRMIQNIADQADISYYDFNLCKPEYFSNRTTDYFYDEHHLNAKGAEIFSNVFSKFFTGQISEKDLFYESFEEKILN